MAILLKSAILATMYALVLALSGCGVDTRSGLDNTFEVTAPPYGTIKWSFNLLPQAVPAGASPRPPPPPPSFTVTVGPTSQPFNPPTTRP